MLTLCVQDVAIAKALRAGTLHIREHSGRFGPYWSISDDSGLIEVELTKVKAEQRVANVAARI